MGYVRWKLTLEYDGTDFCGWQRQEDGVPSIQQAVEDAIFGFCQQRLTVHVAGRTDAGVHARGQVAHFDLDYAAADGSERPLSAHDLVKALNAHLRPAPVAVIAAQPVAADFHARFSAINKLYHYRIVCRSAPLALEGRLAWPVRKNLDVAAMQDAARLLLGTHDFSTFRDSQCQAKSPVRTLDRLEISARPYDFCGGVEIVVHAEARSFLHHQVRNMVGALAAVGEGKWQADDLAAALAACDRKAGAMTAPAAGLCLMRVDYPPIHV